MTQMTKRFKSEYSSLQKIGIVMCPQCLEVEDEAVKLLREYTKKSAIQYRPLFLTLSSKNKDQFEKKKKSQRQLSLQKMMIVFLTIGINCRNK